MKLLIVDDSSLIRRSINAAYSGSVFTEIQNAVDGILALTIFKKMLPDVVTLDITMPHMDGLAALAKMLEVKPNTCVLVISALADHHTAIEALSRGAHQFICKPFTDEDLKEALDNLLKEQGLSKPHKLSSSCSLQPPLTASSVSSDEKTPEPQLAASHYPSGFVPPPES